jgi:hypothetical protein
MTMAPARSVSDLAGRLERHLANPASYGAVITRVLLRTGVNLRTPKPEQTTDPAVVSRVAGALTEMGYRL